MLPQHELSTIDGSNNETRDCLSCTFCLEVNGTILKQTRVSEIYINGLVLQMLTGRIITPHGTLHLRDKSDSKIFWKNFVVSRIDTRGVCVAVSV